MWNTLGTRISFSKAPNSGFRELVLWLHHALKLITVRAASERCDFAFGTAAAAARSHTLSLGLLPLVLLWRLSSNSRGASCFYSALLVFCQAAPDYPTAAGAPEGMLEGRRTLPFWKAALSQLKLSAEWNCTFRCSNRETWYAKWRKIKALWGHLTAHRARTEPTVE